MTIASFPACPCPLSSFNSWLPSCPCSFNSSDSSCSWIAFAASAALTASAASAFAFASDLASLLVEQILAAFVALGNLAVGKRRLVGTQLVMVGPLRSTEGGSGNMVASGWVELGHQKSFKRGVAQVDPQEVPPGQRHLGSKLK